jgi:hypothetical protein
MVYNIPVDEECCLDLYHHPNIISPYFLLRVKTRVELFFS